MDNATDSTLNITIPGAMLAQIDAQVGSGFVDREEFIRAAIRHYLEVQQNSATGIGEIIG